MPQGSDQVTAKEPDVEQDSASEEEGAVISVISWNWNVTLMIH